MEQKLTVAYASNKTLYPYLPMAINSLLKHNPKANVIVYCEDDEIETIQHPQVTIININTIPKFVPDGAPNAMTHFTKFSLIRCYFTEILPLDKILWLDVDTIVLGSLEELWNTDITNVFIAGVLDVPAMKMHAQKSNIIFTKYINTGVLLMNLKKMREHHIFDKLIKLLCGPRLEYPDQDALNLVCRPFIKVIDPKYNFGTIVPTFPHAIEEPVIRHYTYLKLWDDVNVKIWNEYYVKNLKGED